MNVYINTFVLELPFCLNCVDQHMTFYHGKLVCIFLERLLEQTIFLTCLTRESHKLFHVYFDKNRQPS